MGKHAFLPLLTEQMNPGLVALLGIFFTAALVAIIFMFAYLISIFTTEVGGKK